MEAALQMLVSQPKSAATHALALKVLFFRSGLPGMGAFAAADVRGLGLCAEGKGGGVSGRGDVGVTLTPSI